MCSGEWGASPQAWLPKGGATADTCEGFGCQEYFGVCSEVLDVGQFLFPCSGLGGWHGGGGGVLGVRCWKPALGLRFPELHPRIGMDCFFPSQL